MPTLETPSQRPSFWSGLARALALIALFPAVGLGLRSGFADAATPSLYPSSGMDELAPAADDEPELWP